MFTDLNWLAIVTSSFVCLVVGYLWYGPLFGKQWTEGMKVYGNGKTPKKEEMFKMMGGSFLLTLVMATVIALMFKAWSISDTAAGLEQIFMMWLGFTATALGMNQIYGRKSGLLFAIDTGYQLTMAAIITIVLTLWKW